MTQHEDGYQGAHDLHEAAVEASKKFHDNFKNSVADQYYLGFVKGAEWRRDRENEKLREEKKLSKWNFKTVDDPRKR